MAKREIKRTIGNILVLCRVRGFLSGIEFASKIFKSSMVLGWKTAIKQSLRAFWVEVKIG